MQHCLWCREAILFEPDWTNLFWPPVPKPICGSCEEKLVLLQGDLCTGCGGKTSGALCVDCSHWSRHHTYRDVLAFNRSVFRYNEPLKEMVAKWKFRGDYELAKMFEQVLNGAFHTNFSFLKKEAVLVPIPLSKERLKERAFNQAAALAHLLNQPVTDVLIRTEGEKQSKKSRRERLDSVNPFSLKQPVEKPVILIDDIYTTGTTLRHAAFVLKGSGCPAVYSLTLARG